MYHATQSSHIISLTIAVLSKRFALLSVSIIGLHRESFDFVLGSTRVGDQAGGWGVHDEFKLL